MRISQSAIDECESLFALHVEVMRELVGHQANLFNVVATEKDLCWQTLRFLSTYQFDRSQAAYCLFVNGFVWDAEIVIRVVYEALAKTLLLGSSSAVARDELLKEFWTILPSIYDKKAVRKAKGAEKLSQRFGSDDDARTFKLLQNPDLFDLEPFSNRKGRKEVEQRWSFSNIVETLTTSNGNHRRISGLDGLTHMYGRSSHLAHASPIAIDLMLDRATRGDDLHCLEVAHVCRMMSDLVALGCFSLQFCEFAIVGEWKMSKDLNTQFDRMADAIEPFRERFARSQDDFYGNYENMSAGAFGDVPPKFHGHKN